MTGLDVLGALQSSRAIVLRVDPLGAAQKEGPPGTVFATALVPGTVEERVYDEIAARMRRDFQDRGVAAEVQVVDSSSVTGGIAPRKATDGSAFGFGVGLGAWIVGFVWVLSRVLK